MPPGAEPPGADPVAARDAQGAGVVTKEPLGDAVVVGAHSPGGLDEEWFQDVRGGVRDAGAPPPPLDLSHASQSQTL